MTINPPRILLNVRPDAQPVQVAQQEYDDTRKRICDQHPEMGAGELDEHVDYVLCTIARPGKAMEPGSITDPTQAVNAFIADSAVLRDVLRALHSAQVDEIKAIQTAIETATLRVEKASDTSDRKATESAMQAARTVNIAAESICDQIQRSGAILSIGLTSIAQAVNGAEIATAERFRISTRDRWIQTGILAAGLLAVAGAILRGVL